LNRSCSINCISLRDIIRANLACKQQVPGRRTRGVCGVGGGGVRGGVPNALWRVHPGAYTLYSGASWSRYPLQWCILEHIPSTAVHPGAYPSLYKPTGDVPLLLQEIDLLDAWPPESLYNAASWSIFERCPPSQNPLTTLHPGAYSRGTFP